jgi:hypothetical protein
MICSVSFYFIFTQNFVLIRHYMSKGIIFAYKTRFKEEIRFHERLTGRNTGRERKKKRGISCGTVMNIVRSTC